MSAKRKIAKKGVCTWYSKLQLQKITKIRNPTLSTHNPRVPVYVKSLSFSSINTHRQRTFATNYSSMPRQQNVVILHRIIIHPLSSPDQLTTRSPQRIEVYLLHRQHHVAPHLIPMIHHIFCSIISPMSTHRVISQIV